ncbi:hypothetical protein [Streptomyces sp. NPDC051636]|uniref:hypothetical protein n=1 Tax=Streptomyces sp. NPDC051636 TaxID=3365663 RepID=UPI0037A56C19
MAVLPVAAGAMDLFLWWRGEPWSWPDRASGFGLGAVTTVIVGMLLVRRQGNIQEALADLALTEKVGMLQGYHAPWYRDGSVSGTGSCSGSGEAGYDHPDAVPIRHAELATELSVPQEDRRSRIGVLRDRYSAQVDGQGIPLILATYAWAPTAT